MFGRSYFGSGLWISADLKDVTQRWFAPRPIPRSNRIMTRGRGVWNTVLFVGLRNWHWLPMRVGGFL